MPMLSENLVKNLLGQHMEVVTARCVTAWMCIVIVILSAFVHYTSTTSSRFFRTGPHSDFIFFNMAIDNYAKYSCLALYSCINSIVRTLHKNVLQSFMYNNVLNKSTPLCSKTKTRHTVEIASIATLYMWFDWFIYMNLTLSQVDMMVIEIVFDTMTSIATTFIYVRLKSSAKYVKINDDETFDIEMGIP